MCIFDKYLFRSQFLQPLPPCPTHLALPPCPTTLPYPPSVNRQSVVSTCPSKDAQCSAVYPYSSLASTQEGRARIHCKALSACPSLATAMTMAFTSGEGEGEEGEGRRGGGGGGGKRRKRRRRRRRGREEEEGEGGGGWNGGLIGCVHSPNRDVLRGLLLIGCVC